MINDKRKLSERMYHLNANLSALVHIQKLKSLLQAEEFMKVINREIGTWIKEVREMEDVPKTKQSRKGVKK